MTQEDKELLLVDLCSRLPYGVKVKYAIPILLVSVRNDRDGIKVVTESTYGEHIYDIEDVKPYLRPMSSMTLEERKVYNNMQCIYGVTSISRHGEMTDWLNAHYFDYRGLIHMNLAIAVTEENNPYKE